MNFKILFDQYLRCVNRFFPQPYHFPVIGIDIGSSSIKALDMVFSAGTLHVRRWAIEPVLDKSIPHLLKEVARRMPWDEAVVISSFSGKGSMSRYVQMPRMSLEDLRKSMNFDMDKYFPFDPQTIYMDCAILDPESKTSGQGGSAVKGKDKKMFVLLAAVKKDMVEERLKLFKEAGLELDQITLNSIALANAFTHLASPLNAPGKAKAFIDIGASITTLLIFEGASVRFTRDIFIDAGSWTQQLDQTQGLDETKKEQLKSQPGERIEQVLDACETSINSLIMEIRLSIDYFMNENNILVDELFLSGGGALLKGIDSVFEKNLGLRVTMYKPLDAKVRFERPEASEGHTQPSVEQLAVALGLGVHG